MKLRAEYLTQYIAALESDILDPKLFADLASQRAHFRRKCMECIDWDLINRSELCRRAQIEPTKLQDAMRGKSRLEAREFRSILRVVSAAWTT